ncbi:MAG: glycosyltransferase family 4 protein [Solirubrobacterales bacterium]|nr:glycosyltransferase family 4 protein [Solirubrobacterales bacterium]
MKIQLWSYNYAPEPTGIAPLSTVWAHAMTARGHDVQVVAAHPHYPEPVWEMPLRPRRGRLDGIPTVRLPLWAGRGSTAARLRQELTFTAALAAAAPLLDKPDVIVAVSPSFPALSVAMANARLRRIPWVMWLQDILPDGAAATGLIDEGALLGAARRFELSAYRDAARVVVISDSFAENLEAKGVPPEHLARIYNPASQPVQPTSAATRETDPRLVLTMGNVGHTQNLVEVVRAFEGSERLKALGARFVIAGDGVAGDDVRAAIQTDRVEITGVVGEDRLKALLSKASVAVVSQSYQGRDFNVPSKLMNFMGYGLATVAAVRPDSEVAKLINNSGGGWVADGTPGNTFAETLIKALEQPDERDARALNAQDFARMNFTPEWSAAQFEDVLLAATGQRSL